MKTLSGFDYTSVRFPEDYGREALESLDFINRAQDLVLYGDVGTGKTHMATALVAAACRQGIQARFFTTSALVMMLRRAKEEDRLDKELASLAKNQLLAIVNTGFQGSHLSCASEPPAQITDRVVQSHDWRG